ETAPADGLSASSADRHHRPGAPCPRPAEQLFPHYPLGAIFRPTSNRLGVACVTVQVRSAKPLGPCAEPGVPTSCEAGTSKRRGGWARYRVQAELAQKRKDRARELRARLLFVPLSAAGSEARGRRAGRGCRP